VWLGSWKTHVVWEGLLFSVITVLCDGLCGAGLLDEASGVDEVEVVTASRARIIASRLAVVIVVMLLVGVLVAVRLLVHVEVKTDWTELCIPTSSSNATHLAWSDVDSATYTNVTLAPCNTTAITVHLPSTTWAAFIEF